MRSPYTRTPIFRTRRRCVLQLVISYAAAAAVDVAVAVTAAAATAAAAAAAAATATYFHISYCHVWFVQLRGNIAVIERGEVSFATKARRAMKARFEVHA